MPNLKYIDDYTIFKCNDCKNIVLILAGDDPPDECPYCTGKATSDKEAIERLCKEIAKTGKKPRGYEDFNAIDYDLSECWKIWAFR